MSAAIPNDETKAEYAKMVGDRDENPDKHTDGTATPPKFNWEDLNFKPDNGQADRN